MQTLTPKHWSEVGEPFGGIKGGIEEQQGDPVEDQQSSRSSQRLGHHPASIHRVILTRPPPAHIYQLHFERSQIEP